MSNPPTAPSLPKRVPIPKHGVDYRGKVVLAPMVRSGELPSRLLALHYGADLVWGPETIDRAMIGTTRRVNPRTSCIEWSRISSNGGRPDQPSKENVLYRIDPAREGGKLIYQIGTAKPELAVEAAKLVAGDVAGIDVNAGCPKPFSTTGGMGAALLKEPERLASILEALVEEVGKVWEIGISVKIRLLDTPAETEKLVRRLVATGITGLTIHCRTTPMRPRERAIREQLRMIADVCREAGVACLVNGDVYNRDTAFELMKEYGVDGGMIATAAESNSSAFRTKTDGGLAPWREVVEKYVELALSVENRYGNTRFLLTQLIPGKDPTFQQVNRQKCYKSLVDVLGLEKLADKAADVDKILGIGEDQKRKAESTPLDTSERKKSKPALPVANETPLGPALETQGRVALSV
ncbi:putative trna dihydrouridine synthase [Phaeomoniella chlamydospora]|uniref:Putative trna dihydrouridine synthase n=1 Tax=Phaeomoniella chlamydospora TaxID=158046 RepID=A0A0G2EAQ4_PHACM|nr:putative trna dihydrouridine synthase [Phaeomoniella chlamydospora]